VPKTLIFAKDDHHAEETATLVREVSAWATTFAKKITYKTDGAEPAWSCLGPAQVQYRDRNPDSTSR
jgi:hypothetical protein